ncbi:autotransporter outer membrane beta-barrel domain-containing protein [Escherichia coli]|uniref:autotransporter outer membrane beta-barrel domain-containing protein n=1 Tax=Escherichia coli TaxID=562 RepID=UPI002FE0C4DE
MRPEAGSYVANLAAANTLFVMRLNDRAGETRYIDPVTEQERSSRLWLRQIGGHNAWRDSNGQLRTTSHRWVPGRGGVGGGGREEKGRTRGTAALNKSFGLEAAKYTWIFQPQAQAIWMGVDHNAHTEANGSRIENDANNNIQTRLGFRTFIRTQEKNSGPHGDDFEPFVEMNWIHNSKDFAVSMNGVKVEQDGASNLGEIKLGVNGNLNPAASVWGMWACSWVIMATMTPQ